jgi:superfamily I DNA/RNA helicase
VLPLTVTRRCSKVVVEEARKIVPDFEAHPDAPEGSVTKAKYPGKRKKKGQPGYEVEWEDSYAPQVQDGDMILCRTNGPLVSQCFQFLKRGRRATIKGRKIGEGLVKTIKDLKATDVPNLIEKLTKWYTTETEKENNKKIPSDVRLMNLTDKYECIVAFTEGINSLTEVEQKITSVFTDGAQEGIKLSSIHKAKGLEANRVFFINCEVGPCPHPMAKSVWSQGQEQNLKYVGITRAITDLIWVI